MPKKDLTLLEKISRNIYNSYGEVVPLTPTEEEIKKRYLSGYASWLEDPNKKDIQIVNLLIEAFGISRSQAFLDVSAIKSILGNIKNAGKEWYRHIVIQNLLDVIEKAKEKGKLEIVVSATDRLGKYTKCDQADEDQLPWEDIIPPEFEPTNDIKVLDEKMYDPNIEEKRRQLREKYSGAVDVKFEEIKKDE